MGGRLLFPSASQRLSGLLELLVLALPAFDNERSTRSTLLWGVLRQLRSSEYPSLHSQTNTFVDRLEFHEHRGIEILMQRSCVQINRDLAFLSWFDTSFC